MGFSITPIRCHSQKVSMNWLRLAAITGFIPLVISGVLCILFLTSLDISIIHVGIYVLIATLLLFSVGFFFFGKGLLNLYKTNKQKSLPI